LPQNVNFSPCKISICALICYLHMRHIIIDKFIDVSQHTKPCNRYHQKYVDFGLWVHYSVGTHGKSRYFVDSWIRGMDFGRASRTIGWAASTTDFATHSTHQGFWIEFSPFGMMDSPCADPLTAFKEHFK
jgi:hypothetical protein